MPKGERGFWDRWFWPLTTVGLAAFGAWGWVATTPHVRPPASAAVVMKASTLALGRPTASAPSQEQGGLGSLGVAGGAPDPSLDADAIATREQLRLWEARNPGAKALSFRETPPKGGRVSEAEGTVEARQAAKAAQEVARAAPECVLPSTQSGRAGTSLEGWSAQGARVEPERSGCGAGQLMAAADALARSGAKDAQALALSQQLALARARALTREAASGSGQGFEEAARALEQAKEQALSKQSDAAWGESLRLTQARARQGLASIQSGVGDEAGQSELKTLWQGDLSMDEHSWQVLQRSQALSAIEAGQAELQKARSGR